MTYRSWRDLASVLAAAVEETKRDPVLFRLFDAAREAALEKANDVRRAEHD